MGFTSGLYSYPKYKDTNPSTLYQIVKYFEYEENEWAKKNYANATEYSMKQANDPQDLTEDYYEFYKQFCKKDKYGHSNITKEYGMWYSAGIQIYNWIDKKFRNKKNEYYFILDKNDIKELVVYLWDEYDKISPKEAYINKSFRYKDIKDENGNEEEVIISSECDGVELITEDGTFKRIETNPEYGSIFLDTSSYDPTYMYAIISTLKSCMDVLLEVDFDKEVVFYDGGW